MSFNLVSHINLTFATYDKQNHSDNPHETRWITASFSIKIAKDLINFHLSLDCFCMNVAEATSLVAPVRALRVWKEKDGGEQRGPLMKKYPRFPISLYWLIGFPTMGYHHSQPSNMCHKITQWCRSIYQHHGSHIPQSISPLVNIPKNYN